MGKSFKSKKKSRTDRRSLRPESTRGDSTAAVVLSSDSQVPSSPSEAISLAPTSVSMSDVGVESVPPSAGDEGSPESDASSGEIIEAHPDAKAESKLEAKSESKPEAKSESKLEAKSESKLEAKSESKLEAKSVSKLAKADDSGEHRRGRSDDSGQFSTFFAKTEEDIHHEEARREAPDLHDPEIAPAVMTRRPVDKRAQKFVAMVVGFAALLGLAGLVMRKPSQSAAAAAPTQVATQATTQAPVVATPPPPVPAPAPLPEPAVAVATATAPAVVEAAPSASVAAAPIASAAPIATVAPVETAAVAPSAAPVAAAPSADADDTLTGGQLLAQAKSAISSNNTSKAAALAKKAIAKGAGGSAYYILGAAYQTMGSNGAAKSAYASCAKSGCPEAGECASLVEGM